MLGVPRKIPRSGLGLGLTVWGLLEWFPGPKRVVSFTWGSFWGLRLAAGPLQYPYHLQHPVYSNPYSNQYGPFTEAESAA